MGALAHLETRLLPVEPGSQTTAQVRVRNTGSVVDQFSIEILGDAQPWATVQPPTLSLFPGAEEMATVTFAPPRTPQVPAGQMPFGLRVVSKEDPAGSVVEEGILEIAAFSDVFAELAPRTSRGSTGATHDLAVDNRGNAPLNANITAADPDQLLAFEVRPPSVVADPGTAAFAKVSVRPRKRFFRGASQTRPFKVQVEVPGVAPVAVDGSLLQEAILPPWTLKALLAVLGVLVLAVLVWLFLLRPAIESTARQELLAAGATTDVNGDPVLPGQTRPPDVTQNGGNGSPTPPNGQSTAPNGQSPSPTASGATPSPPPLTGGGLPVTARLEVGGSVTVEPGKALYLTDLFFSNPGDTNQGDLVLERSDQVLLRLRVENFRDLDFHFVTPIAVGEGQVLELFCEAGATCTNVAMTYSGYQP